MEAHESEYWGKPKLVTL